MQGITAEMEEDLEDFGCSEASDDVLIAQAVEHYEIARYGMLRTWAKKLGLNEAESLLATTLKEGKQSNQRLSTIAKTLMASGEDEHPESDGDEETENKKAKAEQKPKSRSR